MKEIVSIIKINSSNSQQPREQILTSNTLTSLDYADFNQYNVFTGYKIKANFNISDFNNDFYEQTIVIAGTKKIHKIQLIKDNSGKYFIKKFYRRPADDSNTMLVVDDVFFILADSAIKNINNSLNSSGSSDVFEFLLNPQNVSIAYTKLKNKVLTTGGWSFQHWGEDIAVIDVKGTTKMLKDVDILYSGLYDSSGVESMLYSREYLNLLDLKKWYMDNNKYRNPSSPESKFGFIYRGVTYVGHFENFTITEDAEKPRIFDYSFRFAVEQEYGDVSNSNINLNR